MKYHLYRALDVVAILVSLAASAAQASIFNMPSGQTSAQFVTVGDPGNAADTTGYGAVGYRYQMDKYDVTTAQYTQFLNAVAATDTYGLYTTNDQNGYSMATVYPGLFGSNLGITRSGSSGSYTYSAFGNVNVPVFDVSWGDVARFSNWLQNGQPTGAEGPGTTERGAYTLNGAISDAALMAITRNLGAEYFIPSENEWYKSAYYKGGGTNAGYWTYATQSNSAPSNVLSALGTNNANYYTGGGYPNGYTAPPNFLTSVGAFASSPSAYGTFDQSGDITQWNETGVAGLFRGRRGGWWDSNSSELSSSIRLTDYPSSESGVFGFRVAAWVPEPGSFALFAIGVFGLFIWVKRRNSPRA